MRRLLALAAVALGMLSVFAASVSASATQGMTRQTFVFEFYGPIMCTQDVGFRHVEYTFMSKVFDDGNGGHHRVDGSVALHEYSIGSDGTVYRWVGAGSASATLDRAGESFVWTVAVHIKQIVRGAGPNFEAAQLLKVTITPSGEVLTIERASGSCL